MAREKKSPFLGGLSCKGAKGVTLDNSLYGSILFALLLLVQVFIIWT